MQSNWRMLFTKVIRIRNNKTLFRRNTGKSSESLVQKCRFVLFLEAFWCAFLVFYCFDIVHSIMESVLECVLGEVVILPTLMERTQNGFRNVFGKISTIKPLGAFHERSIFPERIPERCGQIRKSPTHPERFWNANQNAVNEIYLHLYTKKPINLFI